MLFIKNIYILCIQDRFRTYVFKIKLQAYHVCFRLQTSLTLPIIKRQLIVISIKSVKRLFCKKFNKSNENCSETKFLFLAAHLIIS